MDNADLVAVIRPKGLGHLNSGITLPGTYEVDGDVWSRTRNGSIKAGQLKMSPGDLRFDRTRTEHRIFRKGRSDKDVSAELKFFTNHSVPIQDMNGEVKENAVFTIEVMSETKTRNKIETTNVNSVISTIYGMTADERVDVMYYFKEDPRKMDDEDIILKLVSVNGGILLNNSIMVNGKGNTDRFVETFCGVKGKAVNERIKVMVYVNKGIVADEIQERNDKYYIGDTMIGKEVDDIIYFFRENPSFFDNLVRALTKQGDPVATKDIEAVETNTTANDISEATRLKFEKKFREYKFKGAIPKSFEKLSDKVWDFEDGEDMKRTTVE